MDEKIKLFLTKYNIEEELIKYIIRENGKTAVYLSDGRIVSTYTPMKSLLSVLREENFTCVNKGVVLADKNIIKIENGLYTMVDGRSFQGRVRTPGKHKENSKRISEAQIPEESRAEGIGESLGMLDCMPIAFSVLELVFDKDGHGVDLIFRYFNKAMAEFAEKSRDSILNRSLYQVFPDVDKKLLITYADVALNGTASSIINTNKERDRTFTTHCFQPREGFCACAIIDHNNI